MLQVDLNRLARDGRARLEVEIPQDAGFWDDIELMPRSPLEVRLEAQQAGPDVVVRGRVSGTFAQECRRCLEPVEVEIDEELGRLYRAGDALEEEESEDVLPLPRDAELDLSEPIREQIMVAAPRYVYCRAECQGLCPQCGTNLNVSTCECTTDELDERWAPLRQLQSDG
ncbi:MAG: DUF177 domain-containing protein [Longimicrobiales bacterium]|nr:DUF177 domain-containing protein [Longimicrobiales bacterium]